MSIPIFPEAGGSWQQDWGKAVFAAYPVLALNALDNPDPLGREYWKYQERFDSRNVIFWSKEALTLVFDINTESVFSKADPGKFWQDDCLEIFLDLRPESGETYGPGAYHLVVIPPAEKHPEGAIEDVSGIDTSLIKVKTKLTATGWQGIVRLPAKFFGDLPLAAGKSFRLALQTVSMHRNRKSGNPFTPAGVIAFPRNRHLVNDLRGWKVYHLTDADPQSCRGGDLSAFIKFELPDFVGNKAFTGSFAVDKHYLKRLARYEVECYQAGGEKFSAASKDFKLQLDLTGRQGGWWVCAVKLFDADGQWLGTAEKKFYVYDAGKIAQAEKAARELLNNCNFAGLVEKDVYRANSYVLIKAGLEELAKHLQRERGDLLSEALDKINTRSKFLQDPESEFALGEIWSYLRLTVDPSVQTTVEFPSRYPSGKWKNEALIRVFYGALPLAGAQILPAPEKGLPPGITPMPAKSVQYIYPGEEPRPEIPGRLDHLVNLPGDLQARVTAPSPEAGRILAEAILAKRPLTAAEHKKMRLATAEVLKKTLSETVKLADVEKKLANFNTGEVHCHSTASDGVAAPAEQMLHAIYTFMDFLILSDHETTDGALALLRRLDNKDLSDYLYPGQETSIPYGHFNSYPLTASLPSKIPLAELVALAQKQGAMVQWNHPFSHTNRFDWQKSGYPDDVGLSAWEHLLPLAAEKWAKKPPVTGSSDSHHTAFPLERTVALREQDTAKGLQNAIISNNCAMYHPDCVKIADGNPVIVQLIAEALRDEKGSYIAGHKRRLQKTLRALEKFMKN